MVDIGLLLISMVWALSTMGTKILTKSINVYLVGISIMFLSLVSFCILFLIKKRKFNFVLHKWIILAGIGFAVSQVFLNLGLSMGYAHSAIISYAFETIFIAWYSHFFLAETIDKIDITSIILCIVGICLINFNNLSVKEVFKSLTLYLFMISGFGISFATISHKILIQKYESLDYIFSTYIVTLICLLPTMLFIDSASDLIPLLNFKNLILIIFLGATSGTSVYVFSKLLGKVKFIRAVILTKSILIFNIFFSKLFFKEPITSKTMLGMLIIMLGMIILSINGKRKEKCEIF